MARRNRLMRHPFRKDMKKNRLMAVMKKEEFVDDILALASGSQLEYLEEAYCDVGEDLREELLKLSPNTIIELHEKTGINKLHTYHEKMKRERDGNEAFEAAEAAEPEEENKA